MESASLKERDKEKIQSSVSLSPFTFFLPIPVSTFLFFTETPLENELFVGQDGRSSSKLGLPTRCCMGAEVFKVELG